MDIRQINKAIKVLAGYALASMIVTVTLVAVGSKYSFSEPYEGKSYELEFYCFLFAGLSIVFIVATLAMIYVRQTMPAGPVKLKIAD